MDCYVVGKDARPRTGSATLGNWLFRIGPAGSHVRHRALASRLEGPAVWFPLSQSEPTNPQGPGAAAHDRPWLIPNWQWFQSGLSSASGLEGQRIAPDFQHVPGGGHADLRTSAPPSSLGREHSSPLDGHRDTPTMPKLGRKELGITGTGARESTPKQRFGNPGSLRRPRPMESHSEVAEDLS